MNARGYAPGPLRGPTCRSASRLRWYALGVTLMISCTIDGWFLRKYLINIHDPWFAFSLFGEMKGNLEMAGI